LIIQIIIILIVKINKQCQEILLLRAAIEVPFSTSAVKRVDEKEGENDGTRTSCVLRLRNCLTVVGLGVQVRPIGGQDFSHSFLPAGGSFVQGSPS